jgi:hypothetical protein
MTRRIAVGLLAVGLAACGESVSSTPGVTEAQLVAYQSVGQGLATEVQDYSVQASASAGQEACQAAHHRYDAAAAPLVARIREQSQAMDRHLAGLGPHHAADLGCVAEAMAAELVHHRAGACAGDDVAAHHAEANHHAGTMVQWLEHQRVRYQELAAGSGMMQPHTGSTFACRANADGTFTFTQDGLQTHYPEPDHAAGTCSTATPEGCPPPTTWPSPCHDMACHGESPGMH